MDKVALREQYNKVFGYLSIADEPNAGRAKGNSVSKSKNLIKKVIAKTSKAADPTVPRYKQPDMETLLSEISSGCNLGTPVTLRDAFFEYISNYAMHHCRSTRRMIYGWRLHFRDLEDARMENLKSGQIRQWHSGLADRIGIHTANRQLRLLGSVYNCMLRWELYSGRNPTAGVKKFTEHARERFLSVEEVHRIESVLPRMSQVFADYVRLSMYTAQRQANVLEMKWADINFGAKLWVIPRTKNGDSHTVPLIAEAMEVLLRLKKPAAYEYVLSTPRSTNAHYAWPIESWNRLKKLTGISNIRPHDMRRTMPSWQAMNGTDIPIISATLGHKSWASTQIYARLNLQPVRDSMSLAARAMRGRSL